MKFKNCRKKCRVPEKPKGTLWSCLLLRNSEKHVSPGIRTHSPLIYNHALIHYAMCSCRSQVASLILQKIILVGVTK